MILRAIYWLGVTVVGLFLVYKQVTIYYQYQTTIGSFWDLSDRASSLPIKTQYLDDFVNALKSATLADYDATIFRTPENSRAQNMNALLSLQTRMHEIETMNPKSFEYQQAIYQVTAQEQGEAQDLTSHLFWLWCLANHPWFWDWHAVLLWSVFAIALIGGIGDLIINF